MSAHIVGNQGKKWISRSSDLLQRSEESYADLVIGRHKTSYDFTTNKQHLWRRHKYKNSKFNTFRQYYSQLLGQDLLGKDFKLQALHVYTVHTLNQGVMDCAHADHRVISPTNDDDYSDMCFVG